MSHSTSDVSRAPAAASGASPIAAAISELRTGGDGAIIAAAREVAPRLSERAEHYDRTGQFPAENFALLWAAGLTSLTLPASFGGVGASLFATARAQLILSGADASTGFILKWHYVRQRNFGGWPEPLRDRMVAESLAEFTLHAGLRGEPAHGSVSRGGVPGTQAKLIAADGGQAWRINGHKRYGTGAAAAKWLHVWAATVPEDGEIKVGTFLVPRSAPGVEIVADSWDQLGMRATASTDTILRDVVVPYHHAINLTPLGAATPLTSVTANPDRADWGSVLEAALYAGIAQAARDWLVGYLNERAPASLGAPLASLDHVRVTVGEIELLNYISQQLIDGLAHRIDGRARVNAVEPGLAKTVAVRNAIRAIDLALTLVGNPGLARRNPLQRFHRDALCGRVHEPQADVILRAAGKGALGVA